MQRTPFPRISFRAGLAALLVGVLALLGLGPQAMAAPPSGPPTGAGSFESRTGRLVEVHGDEFASGREHEGYGLQRGGVAGSFVPLTGVSPGAAERLVGRRVDVQGVLDAHGGLAVKGAPVLAGSGTTAQAGTATTTSTATPDKRVALLLVNFADSPTTPVSADSLRSLMFTATNSVNAYYQDLSDGAWTLSGDVFGYYTINRSSTTSCDYSTWGSAARSAATNAGVDLSTYTNVVYVWPSQSSCGWSGMGQLPGGTAWINGNPTLRVLAHELGHNFGEHHASTASCTENGVRVAIPSGSASCTVSEYGDPFSIMGASSTYLQHNVARDHYGFISPTTVTAGVGGTYDLVPADTTAGTRLVEVPRGDGSYLGLEYRQPTGVFDTFASTAPVANGVSIRIDYGSGTTQTRLLDTTTSTTSFSDAALLAGQSVTDPLSGATITVESVDASAARVTVSYGGSSGGTSSTNPTADTSAPSTPTGLGASASTTSTGSRVSLSWTASSDNVGVAGYEVLRDGVSLGTTTSTSFTDSSVVAGQSYSYAVRAFDAAGNQSGTASTSATTPVIDTTAPSEVTGLVATVAKNRTVTLSWGPASDGVGVTGYVVSRAGVADRTVTKTSFSERLSSGAYSYTVRARDAAGNTSPGMSVGVAVR